MTGDTTYLPTYLPTYLVKVKQKNLKINGTKLETYFQV